MKGQLGLNIMIINDCNRPSKRKINKETSGHIDKMDLINVKKNSI